MKNEIVYVQSLRDAAEQQSYAQQQPFGSRVLRAAGTRALVAQVWLPDQYAQSWVITLGAVTTPELQGLAGVAQISDAVAVIEWGIGGSSLCAEVDWIAGQQFSVFGSFVRVIADLRTLGPGANPTNIRFAGHLTPGHSIAQPTRTIEYGESIPVATTVRHPVPNFAHSVSLSARWDADVVLQTIKLEAFRINGGDILWEAWPGTFMGTLDNPNMLSRALLLPVGTNLLDIVNGVSGALFTPRLRYQLALS